MFHQHMETLIFLGEPLINFYESKAILDFIVKKQMKNILDI